MITKLKRNPKFDIPYHDIYVFEYDTLDGYIDLLRRLATFSGVITIESSITPLSYVGKFVVDRYVVSDDFLLQLTQKNFNYGN